MYTPIDDKYLETKKNDYTKLTTYLKTYYNIDEVVTINEEDLKNFHTYCWIIMIWLIEFKRNEINDKFFNDIFLDMLATIHSLIHKDIKVCNFLLRNSIENFIRFFNKYLEEIKIEDSPDSIFALILSKFEQGNIAHNKIQILRSIYSECCLYVHSASLKDDNLCDCIKSYENYYDNEEIKRLTNNFKNTYLTINSLLILFNKEIFENMSYNNQLTIRYYSIKDDLKMILEYWTK